jgi:hypothetical protein
MFYVQELPIGEKKRGKRSIKSNKNIFISFINIWLIELSDVIEELRKCIHLQMNITVTLCIVRFASHDPQIPFLIYSPVCPSSAPVCTSGPVSTGLTDSN